MKTISGCRSPKQGVSLVHHMETWRSECGTYTVVLEEQFLTDLVKVARKHYPNEVGSPLVGSYTDDGHEARISGIGHGLPNTALRTCSSLPCIRRARCLQNRNPTQPSSRRLCTVNNATPMPSVNRRELREESGMGVALLYRAMWRKCVSDEIAMWRFCQTRDPRTRSNAISSGSGRCSY